MHTLLSSVMVVHIHVQCPFMWSLPLLSLIDFNRRRPHTFTPCVSLCPSFSLCHKKGFSASEQEILVLEPVCRQLFEDNRTFLCVWPTLSPEAVARVCGQKSKSPKNQPILLHAAAATTFPLPSLFEHHDFYTLFSASMRLWWWGWRGRNYLVRL